MSRLVEKVTLPIYGELYVACAEDASLETIQSLQKPLKKLYEFEQEEENGTLVHLPCKLGDETYWIRNRPFEIRKGNLIDAIAIAEDGFYILTEGSSDFDKIGSQYALLNRDDAERKFKEMEERLCPGKN